MDGQMTIFDFLGGEKFCFDDDVNEFRDRIRALVLNDRTLLLSEHFKIWEHVKNLGLRYGLSVAVEDVTDDEAEKLYALKDEMDKRGLEVSYSFVPFFGKMHSADGTLMTKEIFVSTRFVDARKNVKKKGGD